MLPRWFRVLLAVDLALVAAVVVLGTRLALDGAHSAGRVITWAHPGTPAPSPTVDAPVPLSAASPVPAPAPGPGGPRLGPALLHRLDSDAASSAASQRNLLARLEEAIRVRIVEILEHATGRGG
jgi:hypothetical protein